MSGSPVYQHDPERAPDTEFVRGHVRYLVVGNYARLLDMRRTPVLVVGVDEQAGFVELEVGAFEDVGARWLVTFEQVSAKYQFARESTKLSAATTRAYAATAKRLNQPLRIAIDPVRRAETLERLATERRIADAWLSDAGITTFDAQPLIAARTGWETAHRCLEDFLRERGVAEIERTFATTYVSNPHSGETVKGHAIVLAELGLVPFRGTIVRSPATFADAWSREQRATHILARMALTQALWSRAERCESLMLYRGVAVATALRFRPRATFISATFAREVAEHHFDSAGATAAALYRQVLPLDRLFMSFLETEAMNQQFLEAEGILLGPHW